MVSGIIPSVLGKLEIVLISRRSKRGFGSYLAVYYMMSYGGYSEIVYLIIISVEVKSAI